ncbi:MAG: hypothetical protein ACOYL6_06430 [Bacteriovoracaceae bacterium]
MLDDLSLQVQSIYDTEGKSKTVTLPCLCPNPIPQVSILEMLPAALELSTGQDLKQILSMLQRGPAKCLFYYEEKCQQSSFRPSPCLFPEGRESELQEIRTRLNDLSPLWSETKYPINQALHLALEKILYLSGINGRGPGAS